MSTDALKAAVTAHKPKNGNNIGQLIERYKAEIQRALPKHMTADRMARIVLTECRKVPKLLKCDERSLFGAVIQLSQLGLEPGGALGHSYLLPFENKKAGTIEAQIIIGYRGMIDLARRSGQIVSISARAVREGDHFLYSYGLNETLEHVPVGNEDAPLTHAYAVARLKDGGQQFEVLTRAQIDKARDQSKSKNYGPWMTHYEEMAKKTAVRRLFKMLPVSIEIARAVALDEAADLGRTQQNEAIIEGDIVDIPDEMTATDDAESMETATHG